MIDFTAFCRYTKDNKWYMFNDENVSTLDEMEVNTENAYILFYTQLTELSVRRL